MLVAYDSLLIGYFYLDIGLVVQDYTLAAQAGL